MFRHTGGFFGRPRFRPPALTRRPSRREWPETVRRITRWRPALGRAAAAAVICFVPDYFEQAFSRQLPGLRGTALSMTAQAVGVAYLIASLTQVRQGVAYRVLNLRVVAAVGLVSYGLYLWQQLFVRGDEWFARFPVDVVLLAAVVTVSYLCVEQPRRGLGRRRATSVPVYAPAPVEPPAI